MKPEKIAKTPYCWIYCVGGIRPRLTGLRVSLGRSAWIAAHGSVPDELVVRHRCDDGRCVRLDHLELGTEEDNWQDMWRRRRTRRRLGRKHSGITPARVLSARKCWDTSIESPGSIGAILGLSESMVVNLGHRRTYTEWEGDWPRGLVTRSNSGVGRYIGAPFAEWLNEGRCPHCGAVLRVEDAVTLGCPSRRCDFVLYKGQPQWRESYEYTIKRAVDEGKIGFNSRGQWTRYF